MRNEALQQLDGLIGDWTLVLSDAWFLEPAGTELHGSATIGWLGDAESRDAEHEAHGETWTERLVGGRVNELDNLARLTS